MYCLKNNIKSIDILKMDIQGGELAALSGASGLLNSQEIKIVYAEVYFVQQYESEPLFHDVSKFLYGFGFTLQDLYTPIYGNGNFAWCDAIFKLNEM